jgi:hypothetical protein
METTHESLLVCRQMKSGPVKVRDNLQDLFEYLFCFRKRSMMMRNVEVMFKKDAEPLCVDFCFSVSHF